MSGQLAEKQPEAISTGAPQPKRSWFARLVDLALIVASILYTASNLAGARENFLWYIANVLSSTTAVILLFAYAVLAGLAQHRRKPFVADRVALIARTALVVAVLIPVAQGELRRGSVGRAAPQPQLGEFTVLDANLFGPANVTSDLLQEIVRRDPDIIMLQELNPEVESRLTPLIESRYPCRVLNPQVGTTGMGIYAKFPCTERARQKEYFAAGLPQFVEVALPSGKRLAVVNVHTNPPHVIPDYLDGEGLFGAMGRTVALREEHARSLLAELTSAPSDGEIVAGDFNMTARNRVYGIMRAGELQDAWGVASRIGGGTWPNASVTALRWPLRLDFVFVSKALVPLLAENLDSAGGSDHRGIFVRLGWHSGSRA